MFNMAKIDPEIATSYNQQYKQIQEYYTTLQEHALLTEQYLMSKARIGTPYAPRV